MKLITAGLKLSGSFALLCLTLSPAWAGPDMKRGNGKEVGIRDEPSEKWWQASLTAGYQSRYIFRGTNLTPHSDGLQFDDARIQFRGFTFGAWFGTQLGSARVSGVKGIGEAGAGVQSRQSDRLPGDFGAGPGLQS